MRIQLPNTTTTAVGRKLAHLRDEGMAVALGRVLTLVILTDQADVEKAVSAANEASQEHPCRVLVLTPGPEDCGGAGRATDTTVGTLDAEIRLGSDAGASEVVILHCFGALRTQAASVITPLLLPDAPIVAWWPTRAPTNPGADPVGAQARLRLTDTTYCPNPLQRLRELAANYTPGDTDLAWSRLTLWRAQLAAALDLPPYLPVTAVEVSGEVSHTSLPLLAAWLGLKLACPARVLPVPGAVGITSVRLRRATEPSPSPEARGAPRPNCRGCGDALGGAPDVVLSRPDGRTATVCQPGAPARTISLPIRSLSEALIEELRRLDADEVYEEVLTQGLPRIEVSE